MQKNIHNISVDDRGGEEEETVFVVFIDQSFPRSDEKSVKKKVCVHERLDKRFLKIIKEYLGRIGKMRDCRLLR